MDVRSKQPIRQHLQNKDVQERILQNIQKGRDEATVTISRAAELFGITENKLRDWEEYGFLSPLRPSGPKGRRLYTPSELDKLAIIRELINAGYAASDIPPDIDKVWHTIRLPKELLGVAERQSAQTSQNNQLDQPINLRLAQAHKELFWRYYASHALRLSLMLICEDVPNTTAGLVVPLETGMEGITAQRVEDVALLGECLVGWLNQGKSSHTLLTSRLSFQYSSDFRVEPLQITQEGQIQASGEKDNTIIIVQRENNPLTLSSEVVETIRRLLGPLYEEPQRSRNSFGPGLRDVLDAATDLAGPTNSEDIILNGLADMVIHLGGLNAEGEPRWRFCWIMLPKDASQLLHLSSLTIRAQSHGLFYKAKAPIATPDKHTNMPYIKALQSGHIIYQPSMLATDSTIALRDVEKPLHSAIAIPLGGEGGLSIGVVYVTSNEIDAFTESDQRVLRIVCRMIEELLKTYYVRQQVTQKLTDMVKNPGLIDPFFETFASERNFIQDVEKLLKKIQPDGEEKHKENGATKVISFIAVDIDKQSSLANKYGDRMVRNLTREVGLRIQEQIRTAFKEYPDCHLYHIYADRFLILLQHTSLEQARENAERLRLGAIGSYKLDALRTSVEQPSRPESMIELAGITIRLGVTSYSYAKLKEILQEYPAEYAIAEVRSIINSALDVALVKGQVEGGNVVVSWDAATHNFRRWSPPKVF